MSLDIRTTYLNYLLTASLGIALWYRHIGADRPLGGFLLALSLVFIFEYGIVGIMDPDTAGRLILASFAFAVFILPLLVNLTVTSQNLAINLLVLISLVVLIWALVLASGDGTFDANICSWTRNGEPLFGNIGFALIGILFLTLFFLSVIVGSTLLMVIFLILLIGAIVILATTDYTCFMYYFIIFLVLLLFIYYFIPFFDSSFSRSLIRPNKGK